MKKKIVKVDLSRCAFTPEAIATYTVELLIKAGIPISKGIGRPKVTEGVLDKAVNPHDSSKITYIWKSN